MILKLYSLLFIIYELFLFLVGYVNENTSMTISLLLFVLLVMLYFQNEKSQDRILFSNWIRPSYIVLIGLIIVNLQTIVNVLVGVASLSDYLKTPVYDIYIGKVLHLGLLSIAVFLFGNSIGEERFSEKNIDNNQDYSKQLKVWNILSFIFFCLFVYTIDIVSFVTGTYYGDTKGSDNMGVESSSYFEVLFSCSIIIIFSLYSYQHRNSGASFFEYVMRLPKLFLITTIIYMILRLLSGDRGPVIYTAMVYLYSYLLMSHKKIRLLYVVVGISLSAILVTLLGFARGMDTDLSFGERMQAASSVSMQEYYVQSLLPATQELAGSVNCNFIAVHDINVEKTSYKFGAYHLFELIGVIPGSSFILTNLFGIRLSDYQSAYYLTTSFFGREFAFSLGTTAVAEPYLDFGVIGCIVILFLFGAYYKRIDYAITYLDDMKIGNRILLLKMSAWALYVARASFFQIFTSGLYVLLIYTVVNFVIKNKRV